jgi:hypothetical protein
VNTQVRHSHQASVEPRGSLPNPPFRVGASKDAGHSATGCELLHLIVVQRIGLEKPWEEQCRVIVGATDRRISLARGVRLLRPTARRVDEQHGPSFAAVGNRDVDKAQLDVLRTTGVIGGAKGGNTKEVEDSCFLERKEPSLVCLCRVSGEVSRRQFDPVVADGAGSGRGKRIGGKRIGGKRIGGNCNVGVGNPGAPLGICPQVILGIQRRIVRNQRRGSGKRQAPCQGRLGLKHLVYSARIREIARHVANRLDPLDARLFLVRNFDFSDRDVEQLAGRITAYRNLRHGFNAESEVVAPLTR